VETAGDAWHGSEAVARRLVFDGLTALDTRGALRPALAVSWQAENDSHRWQFRLRQGVRFHDGSALTADSVVQSLNVACAANCPWTAVRSVGSMTVLFTSDTALPNLPELLASDAFLIELTRASDGQSPPQPTGTGPFQVASNANNTVTLAANESCWQGRPFADQVIVTMHRAVRDQWLDLGLGRADVVEIPADQIRQAQQQRLSILQSQPVEEVALKIAEVGVLANPMLRAAIAYAVDRSALFSVIFQKQGAVTASLLPKPLTGYAFLFPADRDLNKASQARGGLNAGSLTLAVEGDGAMQLTAQRLALNLHEAGFIVQITGATDAGRADLVLRTLPASGADASGVLGRLLLSSGAPSAVTAHDPQSLYQFERDLLNQHTIIPLLDLPRACAVGGRVRSLALRADGTADLANAWVEEAP
jgi:peptide/nickel transport system substrate-binding protein